MFSQLRKEVVMPEAYNYVKVCNWAFPAMQEKKLSPAERFLFLYLLYRANAAFWKKLTISTEKVAEDTGISRRSLFSYRKCLISHGFLLDEEGWALNYNIFPQKTKIIYDSSKKSDKYGVPAGKFSSALAANYKY